MQKTTVLLTVLCVIYTSSLMAQTTCASFHVTPMSDVPDTAFVDLHEKISFKSEDNSSFSAEPITLPPGYRLNSCPTCLTDVVSITGEMQEAGTYDFSFTIRSRFNNCTDTYSFTRTYIDSPTHICEPIGIRSDWNSGSEIYVGYPIHMQFFVTDGGEDPPFTFYGLDLREGAALDSLGNYSDSTAYPENFEFRVVVKDSFECTDTLRYEIFTQCPITQPTGETLASGTKGQPYEEQITKLAFIHLPPIMDAMTDDALPPGLTLSADGVISGTPTVSGVYMDIQVRYKSLGGCDGSTYVNITINEPAPVQSLWITPQCAQSLDERNWVVHNPNAFPIQVEWQQLYVDRVIGHFIAEPGDNGLSVRDGGWPNSIRISWYDQNQVQKTIVQAANDNLCTPPECAWANGVTFYHQGRQRNGNTIPLFLSSHRAVTGPPDAGDAPQNGSTVFSLGYNGFITMKLSADIYDQPGSDLKVWEYSQNDPSYGEYPERAEVFVSTDNSNWISLGLTNPTGDCHAKLDWEFDLAGKAIWCRYVKVVDVTDRWAWILDATSCAPANVRAFNDASDGFDLDAVTCANYGGGVAGRIAADETMMDPAAAFEDGLDSEYQVAYPNPATSWLTLDFSRDPEFIYPESGQLEISIIDMTGKTSIAGTHYLDDEWKTKVNVEDLSSGLFIAKVKVRGLMKYYKFSRH